MGSAAEILVIILSVFLAIFLLLGITLIIYLIKVTREIRKVTASAQRTASTIEATVARVQGVASALTVGGIVGRIFKKSKTPKKK